MKRLTILAGILLWCGHTYATTTTAVPSDSIRTKMEIKKMNFKKSDKPKDERPAMKKSEKLEDEPKVDKGEIRDNITPISDKPAVSGNRSSAEEIKDMARRDNRKPAKKPSRLAVSYPHYPGGNVAIREFVRNNQVYPPECKRERLRGRVEVVIAIAPDGTPHSATISKSSGNVYMDAEAMRVAELMPKWNAAAESDDPQGTECVIFVNFRPGR